MKRSRDSPNSPPADPSKRCKMQQSFSSLSPSPSHPCDDKFRLLMEGLNLFSTTAAAADVSPSKANSSDVKAMEIIQVHSSSISRSPSLDSAKNEPLKTHEYREEVAKRNKTSELEMKEEKNEILEDTLTEAEYLLGIMIKRDIKRYREFRSLIFFLKSTFVDFLGCVMSPVPVQLPPRPYIDNSMSEADVNFQYKKFLEEELPGGADVHFHKFLLVSKTSASGNEIEEYSIQANELYELDDHQVPFMAAESHVHVYLTLRLSLFHQWVQNSIHVCNAAALTANKEELFQWRDATPFKLIRGAISSQLRSVDFNFLPCLDNGHWTLVIVCGMNPNRYGLIPQLILHFNSLPPCGIRLWQKFAIKRAVEKKFLTHAIPWYEVDCPQQNNTLDCGFLVTYFAVEFVNNMIRRPTLPIDILFSKLKFDASYVPPSKAAEKCRLDLKALIADIPKSKRRWQDDWELEMERNKRILIHRHPFLKPERILRDSGNNYLIHSKNSLHDYEVPKDYVTDNWPHLQQDYLKRQRDIQGVSDGSGG